MAEFDYIVVGASSAGCVLADRLSADRGRRVLLIDAAGRGRRRARRRLPEEDIDPVNPTVCHRGCRPDYDELEKRGNPGWGWETLLPELTRIEREELRLPAAPPVDPLGAELIAAGTGLGWRAVADLDDTDGERIGAAGRLPPPGHSRVVRAALRRAAGRPNLTVSLNARADQVLLANGAAVGVRTRHASRTADHHARREVILAAGSVATARLLQLSGIGPAEVLRAAGVRPVVESPNVGLRLREHRGVVLRFRLDDRTNRPPNRLARLAGPLAWRATRPSPAVLAMFATRPELDQPDARLVVAQQDAELVCVGHAVQPDSTGSVTITSANPDAPPDVMHNYFGTNHDRATVAAILARMRELFAREPVARRIVAETRPDHRAGAAIGTAAMGPNADDVVDAELRVRGVGGLRVVAAAALPVLVSGNLAVPLMAIAARAAELILAER